MSLGSRPLCWISQRGDGGLGRGVHYLYVGEQCRYEEEIKDPSATDLSTGASLEGEKKKKNERLFKS